MRIRLSLLYFMQFGIWGCYLPCLGQMLGAGGLGSRIAWFYAAIGVVSIVTPPLLGNIADRTGHPSRLLALCHLGASVVMFTMWRYAMCHANLDFGIFYALYLLFLALYMPTMALANTTTFGLIEKSGLDPVKMFPSIRIWGTVGFVAAMWFVNSAYWADGNLGFTLDDADMWARARFQYNAMQLLCSGCLGFLTALYTMTLPSGGTFRRERTGSESIGKAVRILFAVPATRTFLIFVAFTGVCLQISNGFVTPYITHFAAMPEYAGAIASGNATMLFSLSQISEAVCVLLVGVSLCRMGIRWVYGLGLLAWSLRFLFLAYGNPGSGLWILVGSMLVYGLAFNFITIAGHVYIQTVAPDGSKGFAQGLMMFMSNGLGATIGTLLAGNVINHWCRWQSVSLPEGGMMRVFDGDWIWPWLIFAAYAFAVCLAWLIVEPSKKSK